MTRDEHLAWCKQRALRYVEAGEAREGYLSMMSDLSKHPDTKGHLGMQFGRALMAVRATDDAVAVRLWIEGFR